MKKFVKLSTSAIVLTSMLAGCMMQSVQESNNNARGNYQTAQGYMFDARNNDGIAARHTRGPRVVNGVFVSTSSEAIKQAQPRKITKETHTLRLKKDIYLNDLLAKLSAQSGVKINVSREIIDSINAQMLGKKDAEQGYLQNFKVMPDFSHKTIRFILDNLATKLDIDWKYDEKRDQIFVYKFETKIFKLSSELTSNKITSTVGSAKDDAAKMSTTISKDFDLAKDLENEIKALLSRAGKFYINKSASTVTVTDSSSVLRNVASLIDEHNIDMQRQAIVNIEIYSVEMSEEDALGLNYDIKHSSGSALTTNAFINNSVMNLTGGLLNDTPWTNSRVFLDNLSKHGKVSLVESAQPIVSNHIPLSQDIGGITKTYVKSIKSTSNGDTLETSVETGEIKEGMRIQILPNIQDAKRLMLNFALDKTEAVTIKEFSFGEGSLNKVQLPEFSHKDGVFHALMRTNETLVLTGVTQDKTSAETSGVGHHLNTLFGGNQSAEKKKKVTVILITPSIKSRV